MGALAAATVTFGSLGRPAPPIKQSDDKKRTSQDTSGAIRHGVPNEISQSKICMDGRDKFLGIVDTVCPAANLKAPRCHIHPVIQ